LGCPALFTCLVEFGDSRGRSRTTVSLGVSQPWCMWVLLVLVFVLSMFWGGGCVWCVRFTCEGSLGRGGLLVEVLVGLGYESDVPWGVSRAVIDGSWVVWVAGGGGGT